MLSWCELQSENVLVCVSQVPYSLHCNFNELRSFVAALRPRHVIPTVTCAVEADVSIGLDQLCSSLPLQSLQHPAFGAAGNTAPTILQRCGIHSHPLEVNM